MDSKVVNREVRSRIWPLLRRAGFSIFTTRTVWRPSKDTIDVLNFQSSSRYNADVLDVTPFSFCVNLGSYLNYIPPRHPPKVKNGSLVPNEAECNFRGRLLPTAGLSIGRQAMSNRIWSIDGEGLNLAWCIGDVEGQVVTALSWYLRLSSREEVLRILLEDEEALLELWGFGRKGSPARAYQIGYAALSIGKMDLARENLGRAVESRCYSHLFSSVNGAINRAK